MPLNENQQGGALRAWYPNFQLALFYNDNQQLLDKQSNYSHTI